MTKTYVYYGREPFTGCIEGFKVLTVNINRRARVISAPVETGQQSFDNKVLDPREVVIKGVCATHPSAFHDGDSASAIKKLQAMWQDRKFRFYSITTPDRAMKNLILKDFLTSNSKETIDWTECTLVFIEALLIQSNHSKTPANNENGPMSDGGVVVGSWEK